MDFFEIEYKDEYLNLNENEIVKMLQKKKEQVLKNKIDNSMNEKWDLKQNLRITEKKIKVIILISKDIEQGFRRLRFQNFKNGETKCSYPKL